MAQAAQGKETQRQRASQEGREMTESRPDLVYHLTQYAKENPSAAALWCFGLGFVLGWKLKPW